MGLAYDDSRPTYVQVADALRAEIASGKLKPGERLPSVRELSDRYDIAPVTTQNALRLLKDEGLIYSSSTRGYFVRDELPASAKETATGERSDEYQAFTEQLDLIQDTVRELAERLSRLEELVHAHLPEPGRQH